MKHVIIGAGPAGVVAAEALRQLDANAEIGIIGDEPEPPYSRMAIPYLLRGNIDERGTYLRKTQDHFGARNIHLTVGRATAIDSGANAVKLDGGDTVAYDKLLIATGASPIVPPIAGIDNPRVSYCWTLADARKIADGIAPGAPVVLIGAGFIGCIILEALVSAGAKLSVIETGDRMVPRMLDKTCGTMLRKWCEGKGVAVHTGATVAGIEDDGKRAKVLLEGGDALPAELVICATGVRANAALAAGAKLKTRDDAMLIDEYMTTSSPNIFAAGDAACGADFSTGEYSVQAIQPTAVEHAHIAANNMHAAKSVRYAGAVSMNVLDTIGLISASYGLWQGVDGGDHCELTDEAAYRYIRLQFADDRLIGANTLGLTEHIGVLRGLIRGRFALGKWKARLMDNPLCLMEAYLSCAHGRG